MRVSISTLSAGAVLVAAVASAQSINIPNLSESCKSYMVSMVGDEALNACLPIASLIPLMNSNTTTNPASLKTVFTQLCSVPACKQSMIDGYAANITTQCATDLQSISSPAKVISSIFAMYTPLQKSACYLDSDKDFCMTKSITALKLDLSVGVNDISASFNAAVVADLCTTCTQHQVGTFIDYISKNPSTTFPITSAQKDSVVSTLTSKCGADYGSGLLKATGAPFPDIQKAYGTASSSTSAAVAASSQNSISALAVFLTVGFLATRNL